MARSVVSTKYQIVIPKEIRTQVRLRTASDPLTYATIALFLAAIAVMASCVPSLRAAKVDPMEALRYE